jgi:uncharacterized protein YjbI with pentapeptide repeats
LSLITGHHFVDKILSGEKNFSGVRIEKGFDLNASERFAEFSAYLKEIDHLSTPFNFENVEMTEFTGHEMIFPYSNWKGAKLEACVFTKSNFDEADFTGAKMKRVNLAGARLMAVNFTEAHLEMANLEEAFLEGTTFWKAVLIDANLLKANLRDALICEADLLRADFTLADLTKCNLWGSSAVETIWKNTNLSETLFKGIRNLEQSKSLARARFYKTRLGRIEHEIVHAAIEKRFFVIEE